MDYKSEKIHEIAFSRIKGVGLHLFRSINDELGNISEVYTLSEADLKTFITNRAVAMKELARALLVETLTAARLSVNVDSQT